MAAPSKVHYTVFPIVGTVNDRGLILHVSDTFFKASTSLTQGTTLADFMSVETVPKGDAISQGFGSYIYREQLPKEGNSLRFVFLKAKTAAEQLQVVKPKFTINQVTDWPDWLLSLYMLDALVALQTESGTVAGSITGQTSFGLPTTGSSTNSSASSVAVTGQRFLDRYILIRGGNFNTRHEVEEFFSPTPVTSLVATEPRADTVFYNYFGVQNRLDCVHSLITIPEPYVSASLVPDFGTENARETAWDQGSIFPPTNHPGWIPHFRILDVKEQDGGFYYRRHRVIPPRLSNAIQI